MGNDNQAAASLPPVSKDKAKVSPLVAVLVNDVDVKPADNSNNKTATTTASDDAFMNLQLMICLWAFANAVAFAIAKVLELIKHTPCKSTWLLRCVTLTEAAAAEVTLLRYGELLCSAVAALAAPLHMLLTATKSRVRSGWDAVDALAWVALAATVGMHCMQFASHRIAATPWDKYNFGDVVGCSFSLAIDLVVGVFLCCSLRRLELGEQQGHDDGDFQ